MKNSKIEWTHHTANLWWGCVGVHKGCDNCYAKNWAERWGNDVWGHDKPRKEIISVWRDLKKYQMLAEKAGEIHRVFVGSMMDIFEKPMALIDGKGNLLPYKTDFLRAKFFTEVVPNSPNLLFLMLTKRPSNINAFIPESWKAAPPVNVMFGTSPVDQATANKLIVQLAKVNGRRFISVEPQLSPVDLMAPAADGEIINGVLLDWVDWVIVGGESGPGKRPFKTNWARQIRDACKVKEVPYFFKQIDKRKLIPNDILIREFPAVADVTTHFISSQQELLTC